MVKMLGEGASDTFEHVNLVSRKASVKARQKKARL